MSAPLSPNESQRMDALLSRCSFATVSEAAFDDLTKRTAVLCKTPIAPANLIEQQCQWLKAKVGVEATEANRDLAFCAYILLQPDMLVAPTTPNDERFADDAVIKRAPYRQSYAGVLTINGVTLAAELYAVADCQCLPLGMLTSIDKPEKPSEEDQRHFRALLNKPIKAAQLHQILSNVLGG